jgi:hypothetical protein
MPITTEPAPNPLPDGAGRVRYDGNFDGSPWSTGHGFTFTGTPDPGDLNDLANAFYTAWEDSLLDWTSEANVLTSATVICTVGSSIEEGVHIASEAGTASDSELPVNIAAVISWKLAAHYRGGKPRNYLPGVTVGAQISNRAWKDEFVSTLTGLAQDYLAAANVITAGSVAVDAIGCWHLFRAGVALDPPEFGAYTDVAAQKRICTQRRRLGSEF